ncbi:unnamed protein product [Owenia fusiformis]|uniref:Uncharacterized protein n=1 Tax=Owenia fusiformis TaxID=6347 RepID=A0A8J1XJ74_OWEFU|nr:unnamed protein product [Owenia fusiformis]
MASSNSIWRMDKAPSIQEDVYHRVRLYRSPKQTYTKGTRIMYEYNGLTGNNWLSSIGIENRESQKHLQINTPKRQRPITPVIKINSILELGIKERAKSANAILGRRHFDTKDSALCGDNVMTCKSVFPKSQQIDGINDICNDTVCDGANTTRNGSISLDLSELPKIDPMIQCKEFIYNDKFQNRPQTHIGYHHIKRPFENWHQNKTENVKEEFPNLNIRQLIACRQNAKQVKEGTNENDGVKDKQTSEQTTVFVEQETVCFNTIDNMKKAFAERVKSAPVQPHKDPINDKEGGISNKGIWESKDPYLAFLKSKKTQVSRQKNVTKIRGSFLKPLMYSEDLDICCHNHGKCNDCFKACLASDDVVEKVKNDNRQGKLVKSTRKVRPKPKLLLKRMNKSYDESWKPK